MEYYSYQTPHEREEALCIRYIYTIEEVLLVHPPLLHVRRTCCVLWSENHHHPSVRVTVGEDLEPRHPLLVV